MTQESTDNKILDRVIDRAMEMFSLDTEVSKNGKYSTADSAMGHAVVASMQLLLMDTDERQFLDALSAGALLAEDLVLAMASGPVPPGIEDDTRQKVERAAARVRARRQGRERPAIRLNLERLVKGGRSVP